MGMAHIAEVHHDAHPGAKTYVIVAAILAALTASEVGAFYLHMTSWVVVWILLLLGIAKFFLVVGFFMHLKMDDKRFAMLFFFPMVIVISIAVALLAIFQNLTR